MRDKRISGERKVERERQVQPERRGGREGGRGGGGEASYSKLSFRNFNIINLRAFHCRGDLVHITNQSLGIIHHICQKVLIPDKLLNSESICGKGRRKSRKRRRDERRRERGEEAGKRTME